MSDNQQMFPESEGYRITDSYTVSGVSFMLGRREKDGSTRFAVWQTQAERSSPPCEIRYFEMPEAAIEDYCQRIEQTVIAHFQDTGTKPLLPPRCVSVEPFTGQLINLRRGVHGYWGSDWSRSDDPQFNRQSADLINQRMGVTKAQEAAMLAGSMFRWESKLADPRYYDEQGVLRRDRLSQKEKDSRGQER